MLASRKYQPLLLALPLVIYLLLPTRNYYWDGMSFAINIEKQLPLRETLHPNHLLYTVANLWLYRLALSLGIHTRALFLMQWANSVLAAASVVLLYRATRRRGLSPGVSIAIALLFAFGATWWKFATDADAYTPAVFLVLCANDLLESRRSATLAGLTQAAAMLFHQLALLYLPVAWIKHKQSRERAAYTASALAPVAFAYAWAYREVFGKFDARGLARWMAAHSPDSSFSWNPVRDLALTFTGTLRLFFGGKLDGLVWNPLTVAALAALAVSLAALAVSLASLLRAGGAAWRWQRPSRDALLWLSIYAAFLFFWMPQNTFYRLFYWAPLLLLLAGSVQWEKPARTLAWLFCAVVFLWNAVFLIYPQSRVEANVPLRFALAQHTRWPAGTAIAFHRFHPDLWTISYFTPQVAWIGLNQMDLKQLDDGLAYAARQGQSLWLEATAYEFLEESPQGRDWLARHKTDSAPLEYQDAKHAFRFYPVR